MLDGCVRSAKESKEDGEFPHERCIGDSELKTKGKPCLLGEGARGPVGIGCIILTFCHYLFNCFVLCSSAAAADVGWGAALISTTRCNEADKTDLGLTAARARLQIEEAPFLKRLGPKGKVLE